ncbi:MAG: hypothetical protein ACI8PT_002512, partial [Gammaproteobacteria bacterium]
MRSKPTAPMTQNPAPRTRQIQLEIYRKLSMAVFGK